MAKQMRVSGRPKWGDAPPRVKVISIISGCLGAIAIIGLASQVLAGKDQLSWWWFVLFGVGAALTAYNVAVMMPRWGQESNSKHDGERKP